MSQNNKSSKIRIPIIIAVAVIGIVGLVINMNRAGDDKQDVDAFSTVAQTLEKSEETESENLQDNEVVEYHFRNEDYLNEHYEKHGVEMGFSDAASYEAAASDVINNPSALYKTEAEDGDGIYYIEDTNEFVVLSTDGYIRTYFLPDSGKKYFDKQ